MAFIHAFGTSSAFLAPHSPSTHLCARHATYARGSNVGIRRYTITMSSDVQPSPDQGGNSNRPSGSSISQILEVTFRAVWVKLMTVGIGEGYETALKQFVLGCMTAYKAGYSLTALKLELNANAIRGKIKIGMDDKGMIQTDPSETTEGKTVEVDVALRQQEKDTRMIWIKLVYLTLDRFGYVRHTAPVPLETAVRGTSEEQVVRGLAALVESIVDAWKRGYTLETLKLENSIRGAEERELTPAEKSIRSQWMRIIFLTIYLIPEKYKGR